MARTCDLNRTVRQANNDSPIIIVAYYYYETDDIVVGNKVTWNNLSIMFFLSVDFKVVSGWVGQSKFSCQCCQCAVVSRLEFGLDPVTEAEHALPCPALPCSLHVKVHVVTSCIHVHSGNVCTLVGLIT